MDSIPENRHVSRKLKGVQILERWMSYDPWGRNRESVSGSTFFSLEEGSNFVQNSRQKRISLAFLPGFVFGGDESLLSKAMEMSTQ